MTNTGHDERVARIRQNLLKRHTTTSKETRVELPEEAIAALQAMAAKMQEMEREAKELKQRLEQVEAPLRALAEEAKRRMEAA